MWIGTSVDWLVEDGCTGSDKQDSMQQSVCECAQSGTVVIFTNGLLISLLPFLNGLIICRNGSELERMLRAFEADDSRKRDTDDVDMPPMLLFTVVGGAALADTVGPDDPDSDPNENDLRWPEVWGSIR